MIAEHIAEGQEQHARRVMLICDDREFTYAEMARRVDLFVRAHQHLEGLRVALRAMDPPTFLAALFGLDALGAQVTLVANRSEQELVRLQDDFGWHTVLDAGANGRSEVRELMTKRPSNTPCHDTTGGEGLVQAECGTPSTVTILTSGTTGTPKAARHTWASLSRPIRRSQRYIGTRWLCPYPLHLYAGLQVLVQTVFNWATMVIPSSLDASVVAGTLRDRAVQFASGTPTFWRQLIVFGGGDSLSGCELKQVTLGGEAVPQDLLDRLASAFPQSRIVHIYASTEMGRVFSVTDGREGFPSSFLRAPPEPGIELRIDDGELMVRSKNRMHGYEGEGHLDTPNTTDWFRTGDLVELQGDRVRFIGRTTDVINVGGHKVLPAEIENVLSQVEGVGQVRVYPKRSSLVGELVVADVVLCPGHREEATRAAILRAARESLRSHQRPRIVRFVDEIPKNAAFKVSRKSASS